MFEIPFFVLYVPVLAIVEWLIVKGVYRKGAQGDRSVSGMGVAGALVTEVPVIKLVFLLVLVALVSWPSRRTSTSQPRLTRDAAPVG